MVLEWSLVMQSNLIAMSSIWCTHNFVKHLKYAVSNLCIPSQVLKNFLDTAEAEVKSLTTLYIEVGRSADSLSLYFGEDPARCPFEQVTQILVVFMKMFKKSRDENEQAADAEKKKLEKEALKEQVAASSSGKKGVGDADRVKLNFLNQLHAV
uniref:Formin 14 n=1 Tax=Solanum tuberosum TaxID=4113 RepID=M1A3Y5_SOLTU